MIDEGLKCFQSQCRHLLWWFEVCQSSEGVVEVAAEAEVAVVDEEIADANEGEIVAVGRMEVWQVDGKFVEVYEIEDVEHVEMEFDSMADVDLADGEVGEGTVEADADWRHIHVGEADVGWLYR